MKGIEPQEHKTKECSGYNGIQKTPGAHVDMAYRKQYNRKRQSGGIAQV